MLLKRLYNHDAPKSEWITLAEKCETCNGRGRVINQAGDGVVDCPDCEEGIVRRTIPPVCGIKVLKAGDVHHFSPRLVEGGQAEGWLSMRNGNIVLHGEDGDVVYRIVRKPGRYNGERINYYDCTKVESRNG